ncbi:MAG: NAD-dependent epimerase/dehydratase family protein [Phycisphaerales bacterium]|nr:NAD-dependent epimerase/dehydratase family protein [Phycisphaerales bacterium]
MMNIPLAPELNPKSNMRDLSTHRVLLTGSNGFVGRAVHAALMEQGCNDILAPSRDECNLLHQEHVTQYLMEHRPNIVIHAAASTGGIAWNAANGSTAFHDNMLMALHTFVAAAQAGCSHITHLSTSIAYPPSATIPLVESQLWDGLPSGPTAGYATAKKLGGFLLQQLISDHDMTAAVVMPANVYGRGARMDPARSNVVAAMVHRFVDAKRLGLDAVTCWGSGKPEREFIHIDDVADGVIRATACIDNPSPINLGTGHACTIRELAERTANAAGWSGHIAWDTSKPDGVSRVCCDVSQMKRSLDWMPKVSLDDGLSDMVRWYQNELGTSA